MSRNFSVVICSFGFLLLVVTARAQDVMDQLDSVIAFPEKTYDRIEDRVKHVEQQLDRKTKEYLSKLEKQEQKIQRKLRKIDSVAANNIFVGTATKYEELYARFQNKTEQFTKKARNYFPMLDSVKTALKFMEQYKEISQDVNTEFARIRSIQRSVSSLDDQLQKASAISELIQSRRRLLEKQLSKYGLGKYLKKYREEAYYYSRQIREYKSMLNDPDKLLAESMRYVNRIPGFKEFMSKHADLAMFFPPISSGGNATTVNVAGIPQLQGLQTRMQVQSGIQSQLSQSGPNAQQAFQQGVQEARGYLDMLKDRLNKIGGASTEDLDMPDHFTPNSQRTKSFWQRMEFGMNIQGTRANGYWPITTDIGVSIGYKLNDKSVIGIGASYKVGWGQDISHIVVSSQGMGLRSFIDWKIKGRFYLTGGGEANYRTPFSSISMLKDYSLWQKSALLGGTMKYSIGKKWNGNIQVLFDALWRSQVPNTQPFLFRTGYSF